MRTGKRTKRRTKHTRRMKGGVVKVPGAYTEWPSADGCTNIRIKQIRLEKGTYVDRFGSPIGGVYAAFLRKGPDGNPKPFSYESRSLKNIGPNAYPINLIDNLLNMLQSEPASVILKQTMLTLNQLKNANSSIGNTDLRKMIFEHVYNHENDRDNTDYAIYQVTEPFNAVYPCKAAPFFEFPGGAYQVAFPDTIEHLLKNGYLHKLTSNEIFDLIGAYFPPYSDPTDQNNVILFEPYLQDIVDISAYKESTLPSPAKLVRTHTINPLNISKPNYRNLKNPPVPSPLPVVTTL